MVHSGLILDVAKLVLINGAMVLVVALALVAVWDQRRKFIKLQREAEPKEGIVP